MSLMDIATFRVTGEMVMWAVLVPTLLTCGILAIAAVGYGLMGSMRWLARQSLDREHRRGATRLDTGDA